jgi:hypothetical protein
MTVKLPRLPPSAVRSTATAKSTGAPAKPAAKTEAPAASSAAPSDGTVLTVDLGAGVGVKTYHFPTKFHDVDMLTAQLVLPTNAVKQWLPPGLEPASTLGVTKGLVTFQHLGNPEEMQPYSEAQFAVRVKGPDGKEGWHVLNMPVDSLENEQRGKVIFGYPKEMSTVGIASQGLKQVGTAATPDGKPLFSLSVGPTLPFGFHQHVDSDAYQVHDGKMVRLDSSAEGKVKPGLGSLDFGQAMRDRFPGLPEHPIVLFAAHLTDGELRLNLPQPAAAPAE